MSTCTALLAGDWHTSGNWDGVGIPTSTDDVLLTCDMTAIASVECNSISSATIQGDLSVSLSPGTLRRLTFDNGGSHILAAPSHLTVTNTASDLSIIVNGRTEATSDAVAGAATSSSGEYQLHFTTSAELLTASWLYLVGTVFSATGFGTSGNNGKRVVSANVSRTGSGSSWVLHIPVADTLTNDTGGTLNRWTPITLTLYGSPGVTVVASDPTSTDTAIYVAASGCADIVGQNSVIAASTTGSCAVKNLGNITSIVGNLVATLDGAFALHNAGVINSIAGSQYTSGLNSYAVYNTSAGILVNFTGDQLAFGIHPTNGGKALANSGVIGIYSGGNYSYASGWNTVDVADAGIGSIGGNSGYIADGYYTDGYSWNVIGTHGSQAQPLTYNSKLKVVSTDKYWYKTGADAHWNTVTGNWWTSAAHNVQSVLPVAGDSVYLTGSTIPDTAPSAITLARLDTSLLAADLTGTTTSSITIASKGVLVLGSAANPSYAHRWWGSAAADASISFYGASSNQTTILGNAAFYNTSHNNATVAGNALFYDSSYNQYWVQGNARFYDTSYNPSVVSGSAKFYDNSYTENNVGPFSGRRMEPRGCRVRRFSQRRTLPLL